MAGTLNPMNQLMKNLAINKSLKQQIAQKKNGGTYMPSAPAQRIPASTNPLTNTAPTLPVPDQSAKTGPWRARSNTYKGKVFKGYYEGHDNPTFIIDIGHDPKQSNAYANGVGEYWINRDIAIKTANELKARGFRVGILEREIGAKSIDTAFVNENFKGASLVELHNNASGPSANGILVLRGNQMGDNAFGMTLVKNLSASSGMKIFAGGLQNISNGHGEKFVNGLPNLNNALVELGFLTNAGDVQKIRANNGYNVVMGLTNGFLESRGLQKINSLISMQKTNMLTQYNQQKTNLQNAVASAPKKNPNKTVANAKGKTKGRNA